MPPTDRPNGRCIGAASPTERALQRRRPRCPGRGNPNFSQFSRPPPSSSSSPAPGFAFFARSPRGEGVTEERSLEKHRLSSAAVFECVTMPCASSRVEHRECHCRSVPLLFLPAGILHLLFAGTSLSSSSPLEDVHSQTKKAPQEELTNSYDR